MLLWLRPPRAPDCSPCSCAALLFRARPARNPLPCLALPRLRSGSCLPAPPWPGNPLLCLASLLPSRFCPSRSLRLSANCARQTLRAVEADACSESRVRFDQWPAGWAASAPAGWAASGAAAGPGAHRGTAQAGCDARALPQCGTVCAPDLHRLVPFVGCAAGKLGRGFNTSAGPARRGGGAARSRRIKKIESGILRLDASIRSIDAEMTDKGFDVGALLQLQAQRDEVSSKIEAFIAERERLMIVLVSACTLTRVPGPQTYMYIYIGIYRYIYIYVYI